MKRSYRENHLAIKVTLAYAVWSSLWILISDQVLIFLTSNLNLLAYLSIFKGWGFVIVTSALLYQMIQRSDRLQQESRDLVDQIIEGTPDPIFVKDIEGRYVLINSSCALVISKTITKIIGRDDRDFFVPSDAEQIQIVDRSIINSGSPRCFEETVYIGGQQLTYLSNKYPWFDSKGRIKGVIGISRDITERKQFELERENLLKQLQDKNQLLQLQFERNPLGCITNNLQGCFTDWNPAAEKIFGYSKAEVIGKHPCDLIVPSSAQSYVYGIFNRLIEGDMTAHGYNENITKEGRIIICEWHNTPLKQADGQVVGFMAMVLDVTTRHHAEEQLRQYAYYDSLTKLPKRRLLIERIKEIQPQNLFAILHLDLIRFKVIKYSLGHDLAEQLLICVAERIKTRLPPKAMLARIGSDEFAILLEDIPNLNSAIAFGEQLQQDFSLSFCLNKHEVFIGIKIGVVLSSDCVGSAEELLQAADTAMNLSRLSPSSNCMVFEPSMQTCALSSLRLDSEMRRGLEQDEFLLYYQPIVSLINHKLVGFEALIRWQHGDNLVPPVQFIPLAEETGFIIALGAWVLRTACRQMQQWLVQFPQQEELFVSVNLSVAQVMQPDLLELIDDVLQETGLPAKNLKLEITETAVMENAQKVSSIFQELKQRQIRLCIDDFGTGYSSLSYLHSFPFDTLKIDRSFVQRLDNDAKSIEIVRTIAFLAKTLKMDMVAEGVETTAQLEKLKELRCEQSQGYLFAKPLPRINAEQAIATNQT